MTLNTALVAPMPKREREHGRDREAGTATELPPRVAKVGDDGAHGVGWTARAAETLAVRLRGRERYFP